MYSGIPPSPPSPPLPPVRTHWVRTRPLNGCEIRVQWFHTEISHTGIIEDTHPVTRAIGVSHTACKYDFRRNLRSHSGSVYFLVTPSNSTVLVSLLTRYSTGITLVSYWYYADAVLALYWYHTCIIVTIHIN